MVAGSTRADRAPGPSPAPYRVLVALRDEHSLCPLLHLACALARAHGGEVHLLTVTPEGTHPPWLKVPDDCNDVPASVIVRPGSNASQVILQEFQRLQPDTLIMGWSGQLNRGHYLLGRTLDPVIQKAPCDVIVMHGECADRVQRILIPVAGGPNAPRAFDIARALAPEAEITALHVAADRLGQIGLRSGWEILDELTQGLHDRSHVHTRVVQAEGPVEGILDEAVQEYDLLILGASGGDVVGRFLFGEIPHAVLADTPIPTMVVRYRLTQVRSLVQRALVSVFGFIPKLTAQQQTRVYKAVLRGSRPSADFFMLLTLASGIATLGLLLNSPAIIIGAMLVAPLMTAILGMGLSIVQGDRRFFWQALTTTLRGVLLAIATGAVVGLAVPGASPTPEILSRTNPTLSDLGVALISGAAAAYAISRPDVSAALAGVAIAAALAPPLTTVGIGLVLRRWWIAGGASLLFLTNIVSIVAAGGLMFFMLGFRPEPKHPDRTVILRRGSQGVALLLLLVTIPLGVLTSQSVQDLHLNQATESALHTELAHIPGAELVSWRFSDEDSDGTLRLDVVVQMPQAITYQDARDLQETVARRLGRPVALTLSIVPTRHLQAYVPPTPTPTGVPTATPTPAPTQTPRPTPTLTSSSTPTSIPTPTPLPTATLTPTPWVQVVTRVGPGGLRVRYSPAGIVVGSLEEGTSVVVTGGPVTVKGQTWYRVFSAADHTEGWVAGDYLAPAETR